MEVRIDTRDDALLSQLLEVAGRMQERALGRLVRTIARASQEIVGAAVKGRFSGQGPFPIAANKLGVRTGRLRRSIRATAPQLNLRTGEISVGFGSNVAYFAIHEFGFTGEIQVRGHTRRLDGGQKFVRGKLTKSYQERLKKKLTKRNLDGTRTAGSLATTTQVRPHKRKLKIAARAPLGTQLASITTRAAYLRALRDALEPLLKNR
jgi:phage gpG-like protein